MTTTQKIKTVRKFFRLYNFEKTEKYLEEMSLKGWHLVSICKTNVFSFTKGEPKKYSYKIDYKIDPYDTEIYKQLFNDCGWECITHRIGFYRSHRWYFFRKIHAIDKYKDLPEIFSDKDSKIGLYKIVMKKYSLFTLAWFPVMILSIINSFNSKNIIEIIIAKFAMLNILIFIFILIKFTLKIKSLKNSP